VGTSTAKGLKREGVSCKKNASKTRGPDKSSLDVGELAQEGNTGRVRRVMGRIIESVGEFSWRDSAVQRSKEKIARERKKGGKNVSVGEVVYCKGKGRRGEGELTR